jgi:hypothetical protein
MRNIPSENKMLNLSLSEDQQQIVKCERRVNAAKRRRPETERQLQRLRDDAALFGKPVDPGEIRLLEHQLRQDDELIAQCERELADARSAPERRAVKAKRGNELKRDMSMIDQRISAAMESIAPLLLEADSLIQTVSDEFRMATGVMEPSFRDDESRRLIERLRHWNRLSVGERGDITTYDGHLKAYRKLDEPAKPPVEPPKVTGTYQRSKPLSRQARENAAARLKLTPAGVVTPTRR